eukprot:364975-Chlamydomonas_euryale.AAC.7
MSSGATAGCATPADGGSRSTQGWMCGQCRALPGQQCRQRLGRHTVPATRWQQPSAGCRLTPSRPCVAGIQGTAFRHSKQSAPGTQLGTRFISNLAGICMRTGTWLVTQKF